MKVSTVGTLLAKLDRALDKNRLNDAADIVYKLSAVPPRDLPRGALHGHYLRTLDQVLKADLKPLARELLKKFSAETDLTAELSRRIGEGWLAVGDEAEALALAHRLNDPELTKLIRHRAIDRAVIDPATPTSSVLSPELVAEIAAYREAFAAHEAGNADGAREKLQAIGLASPLMEWKLMLRGLIAYAAQEDGKAAENWSRLRPDRTPAQLVAPLRAFVDPAAPRELPAANQTRMNRQTEALFGMLMGNLATIQSLVGHERSREPLFRAAKEVVGELRVLSKRALNTLASVVYWSIYAHGQPNELANYEQVFGKPDHDPKFHRMRGLVGERLRDLTMAHEAWSEYERWVLRNPQFFPIPHLNRIRGTLQLKIGRLALDMRAGPGPADALFDIFMRGGPPRPRVLPSPEPALRSAMELMPTDPEPARDLFDFLLETDRVADQKKLAAQLEERFGGDFETLRRLEVYYLGSGDPERALACLRKTVALNPLDKTLRLRDSMTTLVLARVKAGEGDFAAARQRLGEIRDTPADKAATFVLGIAALRGAMAAKEKDKAAWEMAKTDLMSEANRAPGVFLLLAEATRVKLPKKELDGLLAALKAALAGPAPVAEMGQFSRALAQFQFEPTPYRGLKAHEKLIGAAVISAAAQASSEPDLQALAVMLYTVKQYKSLKDLARRARGLFPFNAYFWFFEAEAIQAPKNPATVTRSATRPYIKAYQLMESPPVGTPDLALLRSMWDARLAQTPDLQALIDDLGSGYYF